MTEFDILQALKVDIGLSPTTTVYDGRLTQIIKAAKENIIKAGAADFSPEENIADGQLNIMYAAWTWRKRDTGEGMPRMIQSALHDRVIQTKRNGD